MKCGDKGHVTATGQPCGQNIGAKAKGCLWHTRTAQERRLPFHEVEREMLGFDHAELGAQVAAAWSFPAELEEAIRHHHSPTEATLKPRLAHCVHLADAACMMLGRALEALCAQRGSGVVLGGVDRRPHILHAVTDGWKGIRRGAPRSVLELEAALPGSAIGPWLGFQARRVLAPVALRDTPLPLAARIGLAAGGAAIAWLALNKAINRRRA